MFKLYFMKKLLFFAILGMSTIGFSQPYTYTAYDVSKDPMATAYTVPDATCDTQAELTQVVGLRYIKFDLTSATFPSNPSDDKGKTFGNNLATPAGTNGADPTSLTDGRGATWNTLSFASPDKEYYHVVRINNASVSSVGVGLWALYTVNFAEAGNFNPIVRFRDGSKANVFVISIFSPSNMAIPLYTETIDLTGAAAGGTSTDGKAKYLAVVGDATNAGRSSVWYKISPAFTAPAAGKYIVKIDQTTITGSIGLGSFTFWKEAAATAPEVVITAPVINSVVTEGSTIALSAKTTVGDGTIAGVEFFDGATSLGMGTDAGGGIYTKDVVAGAGKAYNFKAVVTETGGVSPDTAESLVVKAMSIANAEDNFNGTTYPGKPWNNARWMFGTDNAVNFAIGAAYDRVATVDKYSGVPFFAFDLGSVNNTFDKSSTSLRYVAGSATTQNGTAGTDIRLVNIGTNVFTFSDTYSRDVTTAGAGRFLSNQVDYIQSSGGVWARYSCKFVAGKYKLILRASDNCAPNFNIYARFLKADGTVLGSSVYTFNAGTVLTGCVSELNVTKLAGNPSYPTLTTPTIKTQWVMVNDELSLDGDVIVELSDPDPVLGGNSPGGGAFGEFTFEYTGGLSTADFTAVDFKVYADNKIINVIAAATEDALVTVFDINGKQIVSKALVNGAMSAEIATSGIYIVKMQAKDKNAKTTKVVVK